MVGGFCTEGVFRCEGFTQRQAYDTCSVHSRQEEEGKGCFIQTFGEKAPPTAA